MKGELVSKKHVTRQASFLVLSLRARLLAISAKHARELLNIVDELEMMRRLDAIVRSTLETLADLPLTDPDWMQKIDDEPSVKKLPSKSKSSSG